MRLSAPALALCGALTVSTWATGGATASPGPKPTPEPVGQLKTFAPGVRIDWAQRVVEVDAVVVLREGPLELLACSPRTREHESILSVQARPMHVYQAMGLIGLTPGSPVRFDEKQDRWLPPTGDRLRLDLRCLDKSGPHVVPVERWLLDVERRRSPGPIKWVFAGSRAFEGGRFGADPPEGTVVCLVDFDTALITTGALHSADNSLLWLEANTKAIPPVGAKCTLLIRAATPNLVAAAIAADGTIHKDGKAITVAKLARIVQGDGSDAAPAGLVLTAPTKVSEMTIESVVGALVRAGIDRASIEVRRQHPPSRPKTPGRSKPE